jgi:PAS domain S-box-containing protein
VFDSIAQAVMACDARAEIVYANPACERLLGFSVEVLEGLRPPYVFWPPDLRDVYSTRLAEVLGTLGPAGEGWQSHGPMALQHAAGHEVRSPLVGASCVTGVNGTMLWVSLFTDPGDAGLSPGDVLADVPNPELLALASKPSGTGAWPASLTAREREIAGWICAGYRVPTIAARLYVNQATVRSHLRSLFRKFGVRNQAGLLELLLDAGPTGVSAQ